MKQVAIGLMMLVATASAAVAGSNLSGSGNDRFIVPTPDNRLVTRDVAIRGCIARVEEIKTTGNIPAWIERHRDLIGDYDLALESYPNKRVLLMGLAVSACMGSKGFWNTCINNKPNRDGDFQVLETAMISTCWDWKKKAEEVPPAPLPQPMPPTTRPPPEMTGEERVQLVKDLGVVGQKFQLLVSDENLGGKASRLRKCMNKSKHIISEAHYGTEAGRILWGVRVWRCMVVEYSYTIFAKRCPGVMHGMSKVSAEGWREAVAEMERPYCYVKIASKG